MQHGSQSCSNGMDESVNISALCVTDMWHNEGWCSWLCVASTTQEFNGCIITVGCAIQCNSCCSVVQQALQQQRPTPLVFLLQAKNVDRTGTSMNANFWQFPWDKEFNSTLCCLVSPYTPPRILLCCRARILTARSRTPNAAYAWSTPSLMNSWSCRRRTTQLVCSLPGFSEKCRTMSRMCCHRDARKCSAALQPGVERILCDYLSIAYLVEWLVLVLSWLLL